MNFERMPELGGTATPLVLTVAVCSYLYYWFRAGWLQPAPASDHLRRPPGDHSPAAWSLARTLRPAGVDV
jgi:hypothetical protein